MGWDFSSAWDTRGKAIKAALSGTAVYGERSIGMRIHWAATPDGVLCILTEKNGADWGFKVIHESEGPLYYSCPLELFDYCEAPCKAAESWRHTTYVEQNFDFPGRKPR